MRCTVTNMPPPSDRLDKIELLIAELRAIACFDAVYWRDGKSHMIETLAYTARRERQTEIVFKLRSLIVQFENDEQNQWVRKPTQKTARNV
jgi:hypothetical protein